jgi:hypothetical protein
MRMDERMGTFTTKCVLYEEVVKQERMHLVSKRLAELNDG